MPKNGLVEIEAVAQIGVQTAGSVLDMKSADSQLWTEDKKDVVGLGSIYYYGSSAMHGVHSMRNFAPMSGFRVKKHDPTGSCL